MYNILMYGIRCEFKENSNVDLPTMVSQMLCHITLLTLTQFKLSAGAWQDYRIHNDFTSSKTQVFRDSICVCPSFSKKTHI